MFLASSAPAVCAAEPDAPAVSRWVAEGLEDPDRPAEGDGVLVLGSSSIRGNLGRTLERKLSRIGFDVFRQGVSSSGISRPDYFDWQARAKSVPVGPQTAAALLYMGVNDPQGIWMSPEEQRARGRKDRWIRWHEPLWDVIYRERVTQLIDTLCERGVRRVVVLTPADVRWRGLQERLVRVRRLQIEAARASQCGRAVSTSGDDLLLRDPEERKSPLRMPDGYHLSTLGAERVWARVTPHLLRVVGGLPRTSKDAERVAGERPAASTAAPAAGDG